MLKLAEEGRKERMKVKPDFDMESDEFKEQAPLEEENEVKMKEVMGCKRFKEEMYK